MRGKKGGNKIKKERLANFLNSDHCNQICNAVEHPAVVAELCSKTECEEDPVKQDLRPGADLAITNFNDCVDLEFSCLKALLQSFCLMESAHTLNLSDFFAHCIEVLKMTFFLTISVINKPSSCQECKNCMFEEYCVASKISVDYIQAIQVYARRAKLSKADLEERIESVLEALNSSLKGLSDQQDVLVHTRLCLDLMKAYKL